MTYSAVYIARANGDYLAELNIRARRSWLINDVGEATLWLPRNDPNFSEELFQYGNLVYIRSAAVGDWGGIVAEPIARYMDRVEIGCLSSETLLKDRRGAGLVNTSALGPGTHLIRAVNYANSKQDLRIRFGDIWEGDAVNVSPHSNENLWSYMSRVAKRGHIEWAFTPALDDNQRIYFRAGLWSQMGRDWSAKMLHDGQGANIEEDGRAVWTVQGRIENDVLVYGGGATVEDAFTGKAVDLDSQTTYGLRESVYTEDTKSQTATDRHAQKYVDAKKQQTNVFCVTAVGASIFPYIRLGNMFTLRLNYYGLWASVRIVGYAYDDFDGSIPLTLWG